jgi:hypothetical protein
VLKRGWAGTDKVERDLARGIEGEDMGIGDFADTERDAIGEQGGMGAVEERGERLWETGRDEDGSSDPADEAMDEPPDHGDGEQQLSGPEEADEYAAPDQDGSAFDSYER